MPKWSKRGDSSYPARKAAWAVSINPSKALTVLLPRPRNTQEHRPREPASRGEDPEGGHWTRPRRAGKVRGGGEARQERKLVSSPPRHPTRPEPPRSRPGAGRSLPPYPTLPGRASSGAGPPPWPPRGTRQTAASLSLPAGPRTSRRRWPAVRREPGPPQQPEPLHWERRRQNSGAPPRAETPACAAPPTPNRRGDGGDSEPGAGSNGGPRPRPAPGPPPSPPASAPPPRPPAAATRTLESASPTPPAPSAPPLPKRRGGAAPPVTAAPVKPWPAIYTSRGSAAFGPHQPAQHASVALPNLARPVALNFSETRLLRWCWTTT
ncbi:basic proline-rich protein-like [Camelus ferus]|uniref:Basic proline-rich protein-like n=1 Tax=Camelus ferus TaxID=419612 RepID=A0A8B8RYQ7_CAMFR|nr:basic proline-rich protein-like [Camelus ferus]